MKQFVLLSIWWVIGFQATGLASLNTIRIQGQFEQPEIGNIPEPGCLSVPGAGDYFLVQNWPAIPYRLEIRKLPFGTRVLDVQVECSGESVIDLEIPLPFTQGPRMLSEPDRELPFAPFDTQSPYPSKRVEWSIHGGLDPKTLTCQSTFIARVFPVQYQHGNKMMFARDIRVSVTVESPDTPVDPHGTDDIQPYVIVIPEDFQPVMTPYLNHRTTGGLTPAVYTIETILSTYSGLDDAEKLRHFIRDKVESNGTTFVLLGGDADQIPVRIRNQPDAALSVTLPMEGYFSDLYDSTGAYITWDANGDGEFGTYPGDMPAMDLVPDVLVSRIPASTPDEFQNALNNVIKYESGTSQGDEWFNRALFAAVDIFTEKDHGETSGIPEGERFAEFVIAESFEGCTPIRLYETDTYPHEGPATPDEVVARVSDGCGFLMIDCHGAPDCFQLMNYQCVTHTHTEAMTNDFMLPVVFALACSTAAFDNEIPGWPYYSDKESMPEHFLLNPGGGSIGFVGATRVAMASNFGHNQFRNHSGALQYPYFDAYFQGMHTPAQMLAYADIHFLEHVGIKDYYDYFNYAEYAQFGDPTVTIGGVRNAPDINLNRSVWTEHGGNGDRCFDPGETFDLQIDLLNTGILATDVTARISCADPHTSFPVSGCAYGELSRFTNTSPDVPFQVQVLSGSPENREIPLTLEIYSGSAPIQAKTVMMYVGQLPHLEYRDWDIMYNSSNTGNVDPGDQIFLSIFMQNTGWSDATNVRVTSLISASPHVQICEIHYDGAVGDIPAGYGTFSGWNILDVTIAETCPSGTDIDFTAEVQSDEAGPWIMTFTVPVIDLTGPRLSQYSVTPKSAEVDQPLQIITEAYDIAGVASVSADFERYPNGEKETVELYDDGQHGDIGIGDGVYGAVFTPVVPVSDYMVHLCATDGLGNERVIYEACSFTTLPMSGSDVFVIVNSERIEAGILIADALTELGYTSTIWNDRFRGEITSDVFEQFQDSTLIWTFGMLNCPSPEQRELLSDYLDSGGGVLLCGWDLARGINRMGDGREWLDRYFGVEFKGSSTDAYVVEGLPGDPLTDGLSFRLKRRYEDVGLGADKLIPSINGYSCMFFTDAPDYSSAVLRRDTGVRTVFLPFSVELLRFEEEIDDLLGAFLPWLADHPSDPELTLNLNLSHFISGDPFLLKTRMVNPYPEILDSLLMIALNVGDDYWFWPSWCHYPPAIDSGFRRIDPFSSADETILDFTWPAVPGSGSGLTFYGIMIDAETSLAISDLTYAAFSFGS
ncbi:hypothetical protein JXA40_06955 [bacterium]|nr:hypothetical protein [candidate division CSSED10-310 bacterium]